MILNRFIRTSIILEAGNDLFSQVNKILLNNNLNFNEKILITTKHRYKDYKEFIDNNYNEIFFVSKPAIENINEIKKNIQKSIFYDKNFLLVAFGSGVVMDVTKIIATDLSVNYINYPSCLSNDGICSPVAIFFDNKIKKSVGVNIPLGVIVDFDIVRNAPRNTTLAGVGDLISNLSALEDWKLANKYKGERIDGFAYVLSNISAESLINYDFIDVKDNSFLKKLAYGLILSGLAMEFSGNSRPASGAEHLISHAIDALFPERSFLHGLQVAYGTLLIEERFRKKNHGIIYDFFKKVGLIEVINQFVDFNNEEILQIIKKAKTIRKRYTILNKFEIK